MFLAILSSIIALANLSTVDADTVTTVDPSTWGVWEGWGVSLAWWAKAFGDREDLADALFTTNWQSFQGQSLPGLGFNIARYNAGASSTKAYNGSSMVVSPNIKPSRQIDGFWLDWASSDPSSSSWDWSVDAKQRLMLQNARMKGADTFELFSNSPMWWMCYNHNPSGASDASKDNLQSWNYEQHAAYLANIDQYARQHWDIDFQSVEAFNEPSSDYWSAMGGQEGCHFDVSTMDKVTAFLRTELSKRGSNSFIAASDETSYDAAVNTWKMMASASKDAIRRINVHGYQGGGGRRDQLYSLAKQSNKVLWNSEYGDNDGSGKQMAANILLDFYWLHPTAWVYWQAVDIPGWGLIVGDNDAKTLDSVSTKYFVLAQFSRHIRTGMTILGGGNADTVAAYNAKNKTLVVVAANWASAQYINFDLSRFTKTWKDGDLVKRWHTVVDGSENYAEHNDTFMQGSRFWSWFDTGSVQTFEINGVDL
ncbi:endo-beta-1,6-galactanase [Pochonia chlamydosporia 170]|uniref:Endo-beta-1,6-galactanase n=1 Tax=Pochonia chlamydosporia 170 TaxID=1380566 RepID=A0A179F748_METCM|nr:endo-beta-1,6-galactanase [Pochonia chlamydosporia 170]OAQ61227.1 endo-beta-1,6-galactanase [Pochonia chlamydosporia 170]